jgi:hypothetical protein
MVVLDERVDRGRMKTRRNTSSRGDIVTRQLPQQDRLFHYRTHAKTALFVTTDKMRVSEGHTDG